MPIQVRHAIAALSCALAFALPCAAFAATATADKATSKADTQTQQATDKDGQQNEAQEAGPSDELLAWAGEMDCTSCHEVPAKSLDDEACAASLHTALGLGCTDCHADDALIDIHDKMKPNAKAPTKLKKSALSVETCATCHPSEALVEATVDSSALTDSEGTVVNPHDIPDVKEHKNISCQSCHKMHAESKPASLAPTLCQDCHHEDVYECYTCHS